MRVAIVHEWLVNYAGSEKVVEQILHCYPDADLFAMVDFLPPEARTFIQGKRAKTSFIQGLPFARRHHRAYLPLMPIAVEQLDLTDYDLVLSSSHAVAKGVLPRPGQLHISYVHTPMRYAWYLEDQYLAGRGAMARAKRLACRPLLHYLRLWDTQAANRPDALVANSRYVAERIWKTYRRHADVVYPPVDVARFNPTRCREEFYVSVARLVPYKRVDLIVRAFSKLELPLVVIGDGPELRKLKSEAGSTVRFVGHIPDQAVQDYLERCRAEVIAADEDFGIAPVEAQAAGAPVIAYGRGGATETIQAGQTGLFFSQQTAESLAETVLSFEQTHASFLPHFCRLNAERFSIERFRRDFVRTVEREWRRSDERCRAATSSQLSDSADLLAVEELRARTSNW